MKIKFFLILLFSSSQIIMSQSLIVHKNDKTTLNFQLSDIDSITFSSISNTKAVTSSEWICLTSEPIFEEVSLASGIYEKTNDGLKVFGTSNNSAVYLVPSSPISASVNTIFMKWKLNSGSSGANIGVELYSDADNLNSSEGILSLSSGSSLNDNTWYYTKILFSKGNVSIVTSAGDYAGNSGQIISKNLLTLSKPIEKYTLKLNANKDAYFILAEEWKE